MPDFVGSGWAFPMRVGPSGGIAMVSRTRELEEAMRIILLTYPGERPMRPEFGSRVRDFVFRNADADTADVAAGFQEAVADVLTAKSVRAATDLGVSTLLIAGGVAANSRLRELAEQRCAAAGLTLRIPRPRLCTDNGAMIASFAAHLLAAGAAPSPLAVASDPGLPVVRGQVA